MRDPECVELDAGLPDLETLWQAVLARDARFDALFVFGVRSTGIYCRASCPARRPRRDRVAFFAQPDQAEAAGFRPCKRCRPRDTSDRQLQVDLVRRTCRTIEEHLDEPLTLTALGELLGTNPLHLQRIFKRLTAITPRQFMEARRFDSLKQRLRSHETVTSVLYEAGFGSSSRLYERVPTQLGMTPTCYRRGGAGITISYAIADVRPGRLLVAVTKRGVCAVHLGEIDAELLSCLSEEFSAARIERNLNGLHSDVESMLSGLQDRLPDPALPADVRAAAFEWRVRAALNGVASRAFLDSLASN